MANLRLRPFFERWLLASSLLLAACSGSGSGASTGNDPDSGQAGGSTAASVAGAGGSTSSAPGGSTGAAGVSGSGGNAGAVAGSGGSAGKSDQGGTSATGGASNVGGTTAIGGSTGTGGATGGNKTGGSTGAGGATGGSKTGGTTGAAGATGTGGKGGTGGSTGAGGTGAAGSTGNGGGDYGFTFRPVQEGKQLDYLCTLKAVGASTYVYVRLDQTGTKSVGIATIPVYTPALAKISVGGTMTDLANAQYDYGGGHHNDSLQFDYQGKSYEYYHSSFGFGFRACQPMDCVSIYAPGATTPGTDGCTKRALPEVCVPIKADGTHDPLTDTFKKCPGDSNP